MPYTKHNRKHNRNILSTIEGTMKLISGFILSKIGGTIQGTIEFQSGLILSTIDRTIELY